MKFDDLLHIGCLIGPLAMLPSVAPVAIAAESADTAVVKGPAVGEVVVTGTRGDVDARLLPMTVTVVTRSEIERTFQPSLLPALTENVPGLFVTSRGMAGYGVSDGAAGGIALRGLSGTSGRMMVLIDGHPQYMGLMGHPVSDSYQSVMAERVEVVRSPASVLYGSNAMGGVVNIVTRTMPSDGVSTDFSAGYGSFNTFQAELSNSFRHKGFSSVGAVTYDRTDGHRQDMEFRQLNGFAKIGYDFNDHWKATADVNLTHFHATNPGAEGSHLNDADQSISRGAASVSMANRYDALSGAVSMFHNWGNHWINDGYADGGTPRLYRFKSRDMMSGISFHQILRFFAGNSLTAGFDWRRTSGHAWNKFVSGPREGEAQDIADVTQHEVAGYLSARQEVTGWLTADAGVRYDSHSHVGHEWIPQAGLAFRLPRLVDLKLSASKGFRNPTLREMYMFPPQNPDLRPERLWSYEIAFSQRLPGAAVSYGVNLFFIDGENLIATVPRQGSTPLNINTGEVRNYGAEGEVTWRPGRCWRLDANYSWLHMKNPVIAAPQHKLHAGASYTSGRWMASTTVDFIDGLYTSVPVNGRGEFSTQSFTLWNVTGSYSPLGWLSLWVRGDNLLATRYEINAGYPMPRATVMAGVKITM